jgi:hypothetical protein
MDEPEKLLVLTICKLLGQTPSAKNVQDAYDWAQGQIDKENRPRMPDQSDDEDWH